jgi:hypothetical protein
MPATVFISSKSDDYASARRVYESLTGLGIECFFSEETLSQLGDAEYKNAIDDALDVATHLVIVTSSRANAESRWVRYEWNSFDNEILAGRKSGNIITVLCGGLTTSELPYALRRRQALQIETHLARLPAYVGGKKSPPVPAHAVVPAVAPPLVPAIAPMAPVRDSGSPADSSETLVVEAEPVKPSAVPDEKHMAPPMASVPPKEHRRADIPLAFQMPDWKWLKGSPDVLRPHRMPDGRWLALWAGTALAVGGVNWFVWVWLIYRLHGGYGSISVLSGLQGHWRADTLIMGYGGILLLSGLDLTRSRKLLSRCWPVSRWWFALLPFAWAFQWISFIRIDQSRNMANGTMWLTAGLYCLLVRLPQSLLLRRQLGGWWWWCGAAVVSSMIFYPVLTGSSSRGTLLMFCTAGLFLEMVLGLLVWWRARVVTAAGELPAAPGGIAGRLANDTTPDAHAMPPERESRSIPIPLGMRAGQWLKGSPEVLLPRRMPDLGWLIAWVGAALLLAAGNLVVWHDFRDSNPGFVLIFLISAMDGARSWLFLSRCWPVSRWWFAFVPFAGFFAYMLFIGIFELHHAGDAAMASMFLGGLSCLVLRLPQSLLLRRQLGGNWWWLGAAVLSTLVWCVLMFSAEWSSPVYTMYYTSVIFFETVLGLLVWWRARVITAGGKSAGIPRFSNSGS